MTTLNFVLGAAQKRVAWSARVWEWKFNRSVHRPSTTFSLLTSPLRAAVPSRVTERDSACGRRSWCRKQTRRWWGGNIHACNRNFFCSLTSDSVSSSPVSCRDGAGERNLTGIAMMREVDKLWRQRALHWEEEEPRAPRHSKHPPRRCDYFMDSFGCKCKRSSALTQTRGRPRCIAHVTFTFV